MTDEQKIVLRALSRGHSATGLSFLSVDHVAHFTGEFMPLRFDGRRCEPMGVARTRRALRDLRDDGQLVVEVKRGKWAVHANGREWLDDFAARMRA